MSEISGPRIGVAERERAMQILAHHVGTGRLSLTEFDERSAQAAAATTKAELAPVLADLPIPVEAPPDSGTARPNMAVAVAAAAIPITILAVAVALTTGNWLWLWLIAAIPAVLFAVRH